MKATIYIAARKYSWQNEPQIVIDDQDMTDIHADSTNVVFYRVIEEREIDLPEMPSRAELAGLEIDGLEEAVAQIQEEARRKVAAIHERIANLRCLEHAPS